MNFVPWIGPKLYTAMFCNKGTDKIRGMKQFFLKFCLFDIAKAFDKYLQNKAKSLPKQRAKS